LDSKYNNISYGRNTDWFTIFIYAALVVLGWMAVYSSMYNITGTNYIFDLNKNYGKQFLFIGVAFLVAFMIMTVEYRFFFGFSYFIYGFVILLLVAVLVLGDHTKGAQAWFKIGDFKVQPSEFAKFATALAFAKFISPYNFKITDRKNLIRALLIIGLPAILVLIQNDTGTFLVFLSFSLVFYREGLNGLFLAIGAIILVLCIAALLVKSITLYIILTSIAALVLLVFRRYKKLQWIIMLAWLGAIGVVSSTSYVLKHMQPHQQKRILSLFGLEVDKSGVDYQKDNSLMAISSGGLTGKGYLEGSITKGKYVPEQSTDFIFCTIAEEFGWLGSLTVVALFIALIMRIIYLSERQRSRYNRVYGYCVACILFFHFLINMGMEMGLLPIIGIPLPYVSYGGSATISFTILLFIFIKIDSHRMQDLSR
jgi:rod shape determining protein RodA